MTTDGKSTQLKFWIIFGLFIGLIVGLIIYEVRIYMKAKEQRENIEATKDKVTKMIKSGMNSTTLKNAGPEAKPDSAQ